MIALAPEKQQEAPAQTTPFNVASRAVLTNDLSTAQTLDILTPQLPPMISMPEIPRAPKPTESKADHAIGWTSRVLNIVAYPVSAAIFYFVGETSIRRNAYGNVAKHKVFEPEQRKNGAKIQAMVADAHRGIHIDGPKEIELMNTDYRRFVDEELRAINVKGIKDYWRILHRNQKIEAVVYAVTTAGIALGALLTVSNHLDRVRQSSLFDPSKDDSSPKR